MWSSDVCYCRETVWSRRPPGHRSVELIEPSDGIVDSIFQLRLVSSIEFISEFLAGEGVTEIARVRFEAQPTKSRWCCTPSSSYGLSAPLSSEVPLLTESRVTEDSANKRSAPTVLPQVKKNTKSFHKESNVSRTAELL